MIHTLRPYSAYKDSGVPWLGKIPAHWEARRNGRLFVQRNETGFPDLPILEVSLKTGVRVRSFEDSSRKQQMSDRDKYKRACRGDIAYNMMRMWQGAVGVASVDGLVSPAYVVARALPGTEPRYFELLFRTDAYMGEVNNYSRGIVSDRNRLYWDDFKQIASPFPPPPEQAAIIRFLDQTNRRLQGYIRAKKKLIALLNEQKQAIVHRAVTRGLDPGARLKPSGVEWLGEVPEHWSVRPLKQLLARMDYGTSESLGREGRVRVLTMGHIRDGEVVLPAYGSLSSVSADLFLDRNDLLFNRTNSPDLVGKVGIFRGTIEDSVSFASYLVRLRAKEGNDPNWLNWLLNSARFWAYARSQALVSLHQANLNSTRYGQMLLPVPPSSEQIAISRFLFDSLERLDKGRAVALNEINLLNEYRTRLIADAATGKLDVREAAARLPEEMEDLEPLDGAEALDEDEGVEGDDSSEEAVA